MRRIDRRKIWSGLFFTAVLAGVGAFATLIGRDRDIPICRLRACVHGSVSRSFFPPCGGATPRRLTFGERVEVAYHDGMAWSLRSIADLLGEPEIDLRQLARYRGRW